MSGRKKVAVIGAARNVVSPASNARKLYDAMYSAVLTCLDDWNLRLEHATLVSGGSAWVDHVAVRLFNECSAGMLELHLPCEFASGGKFVDTGARHWRQNPGRLLNLVHTDFSSETGVDSFLDLSDACANGAVCRTYSGFHTRNTRIAHDCDYMIAIFRNADDRGGTWDTWSKCNLPESRRVRIHLTELSAWSAFM